MHKMISIFLLILLSQFVSGQIEWEISYHSDQNQLIIHGDLEPGWHIYSLHMDENAGPIPTTIDFIKGSELLNGRVREPQPIEIYDEDFGSDVAFFEDEVIFIQNIREGAKGEISFEIVYMLCNEQGCLPPRLEKFSIAI
ncbi:MAG: protein-disulfide reductase DsbD N-terminal domain-containing protein [Brumimicrobium sp.]|nr:protein-disulfide reductase DsbD N-terminal domain-containing protein [Brumimicrobium sp.]